MRWPLSLVLALFGVATIVSGGRVLFGPEAARAAAGHFVPWVLWFNFMAGFAYVAAALGIALRRHWAPPLAVAIAAATAGIAAAFALHVATGGAFEPRTVEAMALRTGVWGAVAIWTWRRGRSAGIVAR
jgi:hypothetical protein